MSKEHAEIAGMSRLRFDRFVIDRKDESILGPNGTVRISRKAFRVLELLIDHDGRLLTKDELFETVWAGKRVSQAALTSLIKELRRALGDDPRKARLIETVYGRGYRMMVRAEAVNAAVPAVVELGSVAESPRAEMLLGVLPFDNLTGDENLAGFCDGVASEIQSRIASATELKVVGRSSSFQFRGAQKVTTNVCRALAASHLIDGTVRQSGSRVRIHVELTECRSLGCIWTDRYDGELDDVFDLQERIAKDVALALEVALLPTKPVRLDHAVHDVFLRAKAIIADGDPLFDNSAANSIPLLEQVTRSAPEFAAAWEQLAHSRAWALRGGQWHGDYADGRDGVVEAAEVALRLDPRRSSAWLALAMLEPWGAYARREALLGRALDASPRDPSALTDMANFCWSTGRFRDALRYAEQACELNPLMPAARLHAAQMRAYIGDYEASIGMLESLHDQWPDNAGILLILLNCSASLGFPDAYHRAVEDIVKFDGWQARELYSMRAYAEALLSSDPVLKGKRLARYTEVLDEQGTIPLNLIVGLGMMGLDQEAWELVERASYEHVFDPAGPGASAYYPGIALGPWSTLLKQPRFLELCDRLGLCEYWDKSGKWPDCVGWTPYDFRAEAGRVLATRAS